MKKSEEQPFGELWVLNTLWATLNEDERLWAKERIEVVHYNKNDIIHHDGDESEYMWMLISGKVRIYKEGIGQRQQIIRMLKPYDLFGYRAVIASEPYNSNASAFEACTVYRMKAADFVQLVRRNGIFCYHIMLAMAKDLAISELQTVNLTQKHIRGRLAESLLQLRESYGFEDDGQTIAMQLPREDLANMSNMTTSNAIRTLSQFAQEGLISVEGRKVALLDEAALARISRLG
jgi:CRP-like cAMP-binding protein